MHSCEIQQAILVEKHLYLHIKNMLRYAYLYVNFRLKLWKPYHVTAKKYEFFFAHHFYVFFIFVKTLTPDHFRNIRPLLIQ